MALYQTGTNRTEANRPKEYLTFRVARKDLAMEAEPVRGILPFHMLLPAHGARADLAGLVNFAGSTVPVIDARVRLHLRYATRGSQPKIVIVEHPDGHRSGFIADRVSDVVTYRSRDLRNGVLHGLGRPRRLIELQALAPGEPAAGLLFLG